MKAIRVDAFGPPAEVVRYLEVPEPESPREGEITVSVEATPINPSDLLILSGIYGALPRLPTVPGKEGVGRVIDVGPGVRGIERGTRVLLPIGAGAWRERLKVHAEDVIPAPEGVPAEQLAMATLNPLAAHFLLTALVNLGPGDFLVQNAASSAIGRWIVTLAKERGIKTVNVVRRASQCEPLRALGANVVLVDGAELGKRITAATRGASIKLGLDAVAGGATTRIAGCLGRGGTVVSYGMLSGQPGHIATNDLVFRDIHLRGFWLASHLATIPKEELCELWKRLAGLVATSAVAVPVEATYTLDRIKDAVTHAEREGRGGKIVLVPQGR
ncbi:zinc-dependent alcohol dehydrogenase family protein [Polyangium jinanense]|uniref:enoyl-[acyl-carrier-protein] reductase n=1 Tax=Polyangium jinanense TaxID=2829994 RepID=A0A9X4AQQ9_9BACT|nr:zinc-dependent alcohol dehydrogenase family protein [Polyangium jinanense]MDC3953597.1 zinc-dependent alcohol dehydrogenase family protein [Polyangium jinanense]MDC3979282.1 zinc-dependent alcohol dehydrogenase family protein [Polyangium jinanense]